MKKHNPLILLYICVGIISITFIGISFCCCKCASWAIWQNIFLSMGTGFLSAIVLSICTMLIDSVHNKKTFLFYAYDIKDKILVLYQNALRIIMETIGNEEEVKKNVENKNLIEITEYIKVEFELLNDKIAPCTTSSDGNVSLEDIIQQDASNDLRQLVNSNDFFKCCGDNFSLLANKFEKDKLLLCEFISEKAYCSILALLRAFSNIDKQIYLSDGKVNLSDRHYNLDIVFYKNITDIIKLLKEIDLSLLGLEGNYSFGQAIIQQQTTNHKCKKRCKCKKQQKSK